MSQLLWVLIAAGITIAVAATANVNGSTRPLDPVASFATLATVLQEARAQEASTGTILSVTSSSQGSTLSLYSGYIGSTSANPADVQTTSEQLSLTVPGRTTTAFSLAVKRDGTIVPVVGASSYSCSGATIGAADPAGSGAVRESRSLDCDSGRIWSSATSP